MGIMGMLLLKDVLGVGWPNIEGSHLTSLETMFRVFNEALRRSVDDSSYYFVR